VGGSRGGWEGMLQTSFIQISLVFPGGGCMEELELRLPLAFAL
jgi:hypothetical protein